MFAVVLIQWHSSRSGCR